MSEKLELDIEKIPLDDQATWDTICNGNVIGCFQIESRLGKQTCKRARPKSIQELSDVISLMRPGCISSQTKISVGKANKNNVRGYHLVGKTIKEIFESPEKYKTIISLDEESGAFIQNEVKNVIYSGFKRIFKPHISTNHRTNITSKDLDLRCTEDHKLFTSKGWVALKDIKIGDRIAIKRRLGYNRLPSNKRKNRISASVFREKCIKKYEYQCVFCDWNKGSLDVHHIDGNRENNSHDNLCFLCPNHHREIENNYFDVNEIKLARSKFELKFAESDDIVWGTLTSVEDCGEDDVYDITMAGPNHNFIAGGVVVHNCLEAKLEDDKSIYDHYIMRKHMLESVEYIHPALEPIMKDTYGLLVYQEQSIKIAIELAGMNEAEADQLIRKGVAKKIPEIIAKAKTVFLDGCERVGKVSRSEAELIFSWIEKGQRYLFNLSHSSVYALLSYHTAYAKTHFLKEFYCSYLNHAEDKADTLFEIYRMVQDAKKNGVCVSVPDIRERNIDFVIRKNRILFGLRHLKSVSEGAVKEILDDLGADFEKLTWTELLFKKLVNYKKSAIKVLISSGAFDYLKESRKKMLFEHDQCLSLKEKEVLYILENCDLSSVGDCFNKLCLAEVGRGKTFGAARRLSTVKSMCTTINTPPFSLLDTIEEVSSWEKTYMGISITCSIVDTVEKNGCETDCLDFERSGDREYLVVGELVGLRTVITKKGDEMAFGAIADKSGEIGNVVFRPNEWLIYGPLVNSINVLQFFGRKKEDSFIVYKVEEA